MSIPQLRRGECSLHYAGGYVARIHLSRQEAEILSTLLAAYPKAVKLEEVIWQIYGDHPPKGAANSVSVGLCRVRGKIGAGLFPRPRSGFGDGWRLEFPNVKG